VLIPDDLSTNQFSKNRHHFSGLVASAKSAHAARPLPQTGHSLIRPPSEKQAETHGYQNAPAEYGDAPCGDRIAD
jgi:hypothetical protein